MEISVIVTTYNRSNLLEKCMAALEEQERLPDEVIIADDGSDPEHVEVIRKIALQSSLDVHHVRQEQRGFRAAANRNNGVRAASGDLLMFLDGDVVLFPKAVGAHAEASQGRYWTIGNVLRLTEEETERLTISLIRERRLDSFWPGPDDPRIERLEQIQRRLDARVRGRWNRLSEYRMRRIRLSGSQTSIPRIAFERVNGWDENFEGWGWEDQDLALRLQLSGTRGRPVVSRARAYHQYHRPAERPKQGKSVNDALYARRRWWRYRATRGLHPSASMR